VAQLDQYAANQFADNLSSIGNDFNRVVSDWGRLSAVGEPIQNGKSTWDPSAAGPCLKVFDLSTRRRYYQLLMANNSEFFVSHIQKADDEYVGRDTSSCLFKYLLRCAGTRTTPAQAPMELSISVG